MSQAPKNTPYCFGKLDNVFPAADDGLRASPESCRVCRYKTECLRAAMETPEGLRVREEVLHRAHRSGMMGFWERWSRKKSLHRKAGNR